MYTDLTTMPTEKKKIKIKQNEQTVPIVPIVPEIEGNTITSINPAIRWCFTYNNYDDEGIQWIQTVIESHCRFGIYGKETGANETPHLQGYIEFKVKHRPLEVFKRTCIHWEKCKGDKLSNIAYCTKQGDCWQFPKKHEINTIKPDLFYDWQKEILESIELEPDDRTINWIIGKEGNEGKTSFQKYLAVHKKAFILGGKAADIRMACCMHLEKHGKTPELICVNIPRSYDTTYLSYEGLENIKDMLFYSGKYEGGMVVGNAPHLLVFANEAPDTSRLSADRWNIKNIRNNKLETYVPKIVEENFPLDEI